MENDWTLNHHFSLLNLMTQKFLSNVMLYLYKNSNLFYSTKIHLKYSFININNY